MSHSPSPSCLTYPSTEKRTLLAVQICCQFITLTLYQLACRKACALLLLAWTSDSMKPAGMPADIPFQVNSSELSDQYPKFYSHDMLSATCKLLTKFCGRAMPQKDIRMLVSLFLPLVCLSLFFSLAATRSLSSSSLLKSRLRTSSGAS